MLFIISIDKKVYNVYVFVYNIKFDNFKFYNKFKIDYIIIT